MITKVQKWGNSFAVRIPSSLIKDLRLASGSELEIKTRDRSLVMKQKKQKTYTLKELIRGMTPKSRHAPLDWGPDVGKEILPPW